MRQSRASDAPTGLNRHAIDEFVDWYCSEPRLSFSKTVVVRYRMHLDRSVANMTRADARDFLDLAAKIGLKPQVIVFPLEQVNEALLAVKKDQINGAAVITV